MLSFCSETEKKDKKCKNITYTTNPKTLLTYLKKSGKSLITVTYQSFEKFSETVKDSKISIDRIYFDEAHHTVGSQIQEIVFKDTDFDALIGKTEFYTATPVNKNGIVMYDIEDPKNSDCGPIAYEYLYYQALEDNRCRKYDVCLNLCLKSPETKQKYEYVFETIIRHCLSGEYEYWNVLTFHSGVNESEKHNNSVVKEFSNPKNITLFKKVFTKIKLEEFPDSNFSTKHIIFKGIHSSTRHKEKLLAEFDKPETGRIYILSSCRTIGEGIDTKWANMEVPVDPTNSFIQESQKIGRITRRPVDGMPNSTLAIPVCIDPVKYAAAITPQEKDALIQEELSENGDYSTFLNVVAAFKYQYDPELYELCLRYPNMFSPKEIKDNLQKQGLKVEESQGDLVDNINYIMEEEVIKLEDYCDIEDEDEKLERIGQALGCTIEVHTQDKDTPIKYYNEDEDEDDENTIHLFRDENGVYNPVKKKTVKKTIKKPAFKREKLFTVKTHPDLQILWNISGDLNNSLENRFARGVLDCEINWNDKRWDENYQLLKTYVDDEKEIPVRSFTTTCGINLGIWCSKQRSNKKKGGLLPVRIKLLEEISGWWWEQDLKQKWYEDLSKTTEFVIENGKIPSGKSKNKEEKRLGNWVCNQKTNYKKKNKSMEDKTIRKAWEAFVNDERWKGLFMDFEEKWYDDLRKTTEFVIENGKIPSSTSKNKEEKRLGYWISHQKKNYKNNSMKDETIRKVWEEFVNDERWKGLFMDSEEKWYDDFSKTKEFVIENGKIPSRTSKNKEEKRLSKWVHRQKTNYKNKSMKDETIRKVWEEFVNDERWKGLFISLEEKWYDDLRKTTEFVIKNGKRPNKRSKNKEEKRLGNWIGTQKTKYKNNSMKDKTIRKEWEEFSDKYLTSPPPVKKTYSDLTENERKAIIEKHLKQQNIKNGYQSTNPEDKDIINTVFANNIPKVDGKVVFLDHTEFKTSYALLLSGIRPEDMIIPQREENYQQMSQHELFGDSVVLGEFNDILEDTLKTDKIKGIYADFCSSLKTECIPFISLVGKYKTNMVKKVVIGFTATLRDPEGVRFGGQGIVQMEKHISKTVGGVENLFYKDGIIPDDAGPYTYGNGAPMATWMIQ